MHYSEVRRYSKDEGSAKFSVAIGSDQGLTYLKKATNVILKMQFGSDVWPYR
jgi:hypothetical protein